MARLMSYDWTASLKGVARENEEDFMWQRLQILGLLGFLVLFDEQGVSAFYPPAFPPNPSSIGECSAAWQNFDRQTGEPLRRNIQCYESCGDPFREPTRVNACQNRCDAIYRKEEQEMANLSRQAQQGYDICFAQAERNQRLREGQEQQYEAQKQAYEEQQRRVQEQRQQQETMRRAQEGWQLQQQQHAEVQRRAQAERQRQQRERQRAAENIRREMQREYQAAAQQSLMEANNSLRVDHERLQQSLSNVTEMVEENAPYQLSLIHI